MTRKARNLQEDLTKANEVLDARDEKPVELIHWTELPIEELDPFVDPAFLKRLAKRLPTVGYFASWVDFKTDPDGKKYHPKQPASTDQLREALELWASNEGHDLTKRVADPK